MHTGPEFTTVLFLCVALGLGVFARYFARWLKLPYTIILLLAGLAAGTTLQVPIMSEHAGVLNLLETGAQIAPDLIIFVFLPALVFESSFDLNVHAFRKELAGILVFAIPALLVSTLLVGLWTLLVSGLGWHWSWMSALVFGSLISATDPVAVVAILRETTSPKRLGMLIEGESLMNDGTAIVIFGALMGLLTSVSGGEIQIGEEVLGFLWVVAGGVAVGLIMAKIAATIIGLTFNDAIIEISLTIVTAYGAMFVAEGLMHVSGVMAVVSAGLYLSGPGQTQISPEVKHFLDAFWSMVAHIANTLIFFLVGIVIAAQHDQASFVDYEIIALVFLGVVAIRFVTTFAFRPLVSLVTTPLGTRETVAMAWGGLRGAVSLALALMVSQHQGLPESFRQQILLLTAGVVFFTIVVNGGTIAWLLDKLGLTLQSEAEQARVLGVQTRILADVEVRLEKLAERPDLAMVPWDDVRNELEAERDILKTEELRNKEILSSRTNKETALTHWQQACDMERKAYWQAFSSGVLSREGTRILDHAIALHSDILATPNPIVPKTRIPQTKGMGQRIASKLGRRSLFSRWQFEHLALLYDLSRAQMMAASQVISQMDQLYEGPQLWNAEVREAYLGFLRTAKEELEGLRSSLPEVAHAIERRLASRIRLNLELSSFQEQRDTGALSPDVAKRCIENVEVRIKALLRTPHVDTLPETADIVCNMPLFRNLGHDALRHLADKTEELLFSPGEVLIQQGEKSDCMYVITRGAVHVYTRSRNKEIFLDTLGGGEIVGEMALLTGNPRNASVRAVTMTTVGRIGLSDFQLIMDTSPALRSRVWQAFSYHALRNVLRRDWRFSSLTPTAIEEWWLSREVSEGLENGEVIDPNFSSSDKQAEFLFVVSGTLDVSGSTRESPCILGVEKHGVYRVLSEAHVIRLPGIPKVTTEELQQALDERG